MIALRVLRTAKLGCLVLAAGCGGVGEVLAQPPAADLAGSDVEETIKGQAFGRLADPYLLEGREVDIKIIEPEVSAARIFARIGRSGEVSLADPFPLDARADGEERIAGVFGNWGECDTSWSVGAETMIEQVNLYPEETGLGEVVGLVAASSQAMADWIMRGLPFDAGDSYLEFYMVSEATHAKGECIQEGSLKLSYDAVLAPGLNIIRVEYVSMVPFGDGTMEFLEKRLTREENFPDDMSWYLQDMSH